jgi:cob(I)alamin adenosyltransferase
VELNEKEFVAPLVLAYINRLSDYIFVLGRKFTQDLGAPEQAWHPRMD